MKCLSHIYIAIFLTFFTSLTYADTCTFDGEAIPQCRIQLGPNGEEPNILIQWTMPTERADDTPLPLSEINKVRAYFKDNITGNWLTHKSIYDHDLALAIYQVESNYTIRFTCFDTEERESAATQDIIVDLIRDVVSNAPPNAPGTFSVKVKIIND